MYQMFTKRHQVSPTLTLNWNPARGTSSVCEPNVLYMLLSIVWAQEIDPRTKLCKKQTANTHTKKTIKQKKNDKQSLEKKVWNKKNRVVKSCNKRTNCCFTLVILPCLHSHIFWDFRFYQTSPSDVWTGTSAYHGLFAG